MPLQQHMERISVPPPHLGPRARLCLWSRVAVSSVSAVSGVSAATVGPRLHQAEVTRTAAMNLTQDLEIMVAFQHLSTSSNNQIRFQVNVSTKLLEQADILLLEQEDSGYVGDMFGFWVEGVIQVSSL